MTRVTIGTALVSYDRPALLAETVESYLATVTEPYRLVIVDNGSGDETLQWLRDSGLDVTFVGRNIYPGPAANIGFERLAATDVLHRSDNDVRYLPGWADTLRETLIEHPGWAQISLRTSEEEPNDEAVGGNMAIRREVYDSGIRYTRHGWRRVPWEDGDLSLRIQQAGYGWGRVPRPCIVHIGALRREDVDDPYTIETYRVRGISDVLDGLRRG